MQFIAIDQAAAERIVQERRFQSVEFTEGHKLTNLLSGASKGTATLLDLVLVDEINGLYLFDKLNSTHNIIIIDLVNSNLLSFQKGGGLLLTMQRLLRFCIKYWSNRPLATSYERVIPKSTKAVVFPYPYSAQTQFRLSIERSPDLKRMESRKHLGNFLLVYKASYEEGQGSREDPDVSTFRKAVGSLEAARKRVPQVIADERVTGRSNVQAVSVTELEQRTKIITPTLGLEQWRHYLTDRQREFIEAPLNRPHRLEGPAGTGKTLCLVLKAITMLRKASQSDEALRLLFVLHSESMRETVAEYFHGNEEDWQTYLESSSVRRIEFHTLLTLSKSILAQDIQEAEYLERDSEQAKFMQQLYVQEAIDEVRNSLLGTYALLLSEEFKTLFNGTDDWSLAELLSHEISVVIKGRCEENLDVYKRLPPLRYGLPISTPGDKGLSWQVYLDYNRKLSSIGLFDLDDIVISTMGQLDTPIWRRRRAKEGYDGIFVDEAHLFNLNELSIFHFLTKSMALFPIAFSVDRSQAVGDRGWDLELGGSDIVAFLGSDLSTDTTTLKSVFRCATPIVNLAFSVTASGATLFTNFENPLLDVQEGLTAEEEARAIIPTYRLLPSDDAMISDTYEVLQEMATELDEGRSNFRAVFFNESLLRDMRVYCESNNKPLMQITKRGDSDAVRKAASRGCFLFGHADYIGGLEFLGVVLVGVDKGRVPPLEGDGLGVTSGFLRYSALNRLYVAITRARYRVNILGSRVRGTSPLLEPAFTQGFVRTEDN